MESGTKGEMMIVDDFLKELGVVAEFLSLKGT